MLCVDIDLKDGTQFHLKGEEAERAKHVSTDEMGLINFGDVIITPIANLSSYYCFGEEVIEKINPLTNTDFIDKLTTAVISSINQKHREAGKAPLNI